MENQLISKNSVNFQENHKKSPPAGNVVVAQGIIGIPGCNFRPEVDFTLKLGISWILQNYR